MFEELKKVYKKIQDNLECLNQSATLIDIGKGHKNLSSSLLQINMYQNGSKIIQSKLRKISLIKQEKQVVPYILSNFANTFTVPVKYFINFSKLKLLSLSHAYSLLASNVGEIFGIFKSGLSLIYGRANHTAVYNNTEFQFKQILPFKNKNSQAVNSPGVGIKFIKDQVGILTSQNLFEQMVFD